MVQQTKLLMHSRPGSCIEKKIQVETKKFKQSSLVWSVCLPSVERREHWPEGGKS